LGGTAKGPALPALLLFNAAGGAGRSQGLSRTGTVPVSVAELVAVMGTAPFGDRVPEKTPRNGETPERASRARGMGRWVACSIGGPKVLPAPPKE